MSELAICVENISKQYRLGNLQSRYKTVRENFTDILLTPFRQLWPTEPKTLWVLKEVSFEVKPGEVLGVIGRNGAGKSTLLKIISRITRPTQGRIEIYGRIGSLLEVGTGFHPELSGRENIYLNGAILGMKKAEIERKFDEIVAFAELEQFIDTPVKRYSSGMYMRLAFAVAAHLEPEILLIDEVLAVGDVGFQRKCLNKMRDVGLGGRTVLFVSHNMSAITRLCPRTILLDEGQIKCDGPSSQVVSIYLKSGIGTTAERTWLLDQRPGNEIVQLCAVRVRAEDNRVTETIDIRKSVMLEMEYEVLTPGSVLVPNFHFFNEEGVYLFVSGDTTTLWRTQPRPVGRYVSTVSIPGNFLAEGSIIVGAAITTLRPEIVHFYERDAVAFQVVDTLDGNSARGEYGGSMPGVVRPLLSWTTRPQDQNLGT